MSAATSGTRQSSAAPGRLSIWAACLLALAVAAPTTAQGGAREDRAACWDAYSLCVIGAGREERWRTVCYSDYSACMRSPGDISCQADDKTACSSARDECTDRSDGSEVVSYHCNQDYQVCLDSFGC